MLFYIIWLTCGIIALILAYKEVIKNVKDSKPEGMITRDQMMTVRVMLVGFSLLLGPISLMMAIYGRWFKRINEDN